MFHVCTFAHTRAQNTAFPIQSSVGMCPLHQKAITVKWFTEYSVLPREGVV